MNARFPGYDVIHQFYLDFSGHSVSCNIIHTWQCVTKQDHTKINVGNCIVCRKEFVNDNIQIEDPGMYDSVSLKRDT